MAEIVKLQEAEVSDAAARCAGVLGRGGLAVVPTDTVYGLAADAQDAAAVSRIYELKGREAGKALVLMVAGREAALELALEEERESLFRLGSLWPGPLTLVFEAVDDPLVRNLAPSSRRLGVRVPANPFMLRLLELAGPLAVTSANPAGGREPTSFAEVEESILAGVEVAVDAGKAGSGKPSTVARLSGDVVEILRRGDIGERELYRALREE